MLHLSLHPYLGVAVKVHKYLSHILKYIAQTSEGAWLWVCLRLPAHESVHFCVYVCFSVLHVNWCMSYMYVSLCISMCVCCCVPFCMIMNLCVYLYVHAHMCVCINMMMVYASSRQTYPS